MEVINYLLATDVDENNIVNTIINNYFNVDQRREFNKHVYKLYVAGITDADDETELPKSEFESTTFKEMYLIGFMSNLNILTELEQYLSSDEQDDLEEWLIKEFDITSYDIDGIDD
jgi:hypothetical protein